jgi:TRAP-type C4-dicarboxylate transport system permease large subunit
VETASTGEKLVMIAKYILPMSLVVFSVVGFILLGIATPVGGRGLRRAVGAGARRRYGRLSREMLLKSVEGTLRVTVMVFFIILASKTFSQILAFSGATSGMIRWATDFEVSALTMLLVMFAVLLVLGMFVDAISMMLLTIPIFFPIATALGFDPIWFGLIMLLAIEMSGTTPPFGLLLFVMQGVAPRGTTYWQIVHAAVPYLLCDLILLVLLIALPGLALWLPSLRL